MVPYKEITGIKPGSPLRILGKEVGTIKEFEVSEPEIVPGTPQGAHSSMFHKKITTDLIIVQREVEVG